MVTEIYTDGGVRGNRTSANRLIGVVLMDLHDEWLSSTRKYINFNQ